VPDALIVHIGDQIEVQLFDLSVCPVNMTTQLSGKCQQQRTGLASGVDRSSATGEYKAVRRRTTVNKEKTRMSWPVFVEPPRELVVGPHPQLVTDEAPARYRAKKFKDYQRCKINKLPM
jgi:hypothetical protein